MKIRPARPEDAPAMADLLNRISAILAEGNAALLGWQCVGWWQGKAHIGTFVAPGAQAKGIGTRLFASTCTAARATGLTEIHATIRADNTPGLAYYARIGFTDYAHDPDWALDNGQKAGRISRRFDL